MISNIIVKLKSQAELETLDFPAKLIANSFSINLNHILLKWLDYSKEKRQQRRLPKTATILRRRFASRFKNSYFILHRIFLNKNRSHAIIFRFDTVADCSLRIKTTPSNNASNENVIVQRKQQGEYSLLSFIFWVNID